MTPARFRAFAVECHDFNKPESVKKQRDDGAIGKPLSAMLDKCAHAGNRVSYCNSDTCPRKTEW